MATRSLGSLTVDLIARVGGFVEGMGKAEREADRRAKAIERRLQKMGKVIDAALQVAAAAAVSAAAAIAVGMKNAIDRMDELAKSSQKIGIGTEALSKLAYAADLSGVAFGQLEGALAKLAKSQDMAAQGAKEQLDIFRALGVEFQRSDGTLRNVEDVFSDLADRFQALPDGANKTAAAMALLGRSGAQLIPLLNGGSDGLREMGDELERLGGVVTPEAARQAEEFNDNLSRLKVAANGLWITLATELLPDLVQFTEEMVDGAKESGGLRDQVRDLAGVLRDVASFADIAADSIQALTLQVIGMGQAMSGVAKLNPFAAIGVWAMGGDSALQDFEDAANAWALIDDQFEKAPAFDIDESLRAGQALSDRAKRALGAADAERRLAEALEHQRSEEERARAAKEAAAAAARAAAMEERERLKALRELALAQESLNGVLRAQAEEMGGPLARAAFEYQDTMVRLAGVEE